MSKIFYDTEFLEGTQKGTFKNTSPTIDLISIGMVREDGKEYYAISKEFNLKEAWNRYDVAKGLVPHKIHWIRENVLLPIYKEFVNGDMRNQISFTYEGMKRVLNMFGKTRQELRMEITAFCNPVNEKVFTPVEFYGYYSAYDHVALCWLFGKMIDLPKGFPMYTRDLKQIYDEKDKGKVTRMKDYANYPKEENAHSAIHDARWNFKLYEFLMNTK